MTQAQMTRYNEATKELPLQGMSIQQIGVMMKINAIPAQFVGFVDGFKYPVFVTENSFQIFLAGQWEQPFDIKVAARILA